ncbi:hypothetical protein KY284_029364 [Solanum tuberosum]|nr:hypothetical protein KY284_029364 [Solanum tuberosum]
MQKCYNCGKKGHYARNCWYKKAEGNVATSTQNKKDEEEIWDFETSYAVEETNQQEELVTCHSNKEEEIALATVSEKLVDYEHDWIVDSGCSNHMTGDEKKLINMSEYKGGRVVVTANNSKTPITHIGKTVFVPHHNSRQMELQNVYHVPGRRLESIYGMPTETTYVVLDEAPTRWYNEVSLPVSRKLEQELQYKLEEEEEEQRSEAEHEQEVYEKYNLHTEEIFSKGENKNSWKTRVHETLELLQEKVQEALQPQLRRKTRLKCSNSKYIDATLAEMVNNKDATTFEEASKSRDRNNPMKEEILKGHGRHDACRARIAHNGRKGKIKFVLTGCYDGLGRIWKAAGSCTHLLEGHTGAVTSVCVVNPRVAQDGADQIVATASKDRTLRLWKFDADEPSDQIKRIRAYKILHGHNASVQSVAANPAGDMVCSGSWDCQIALWQASGSDTGDVVSVKKRKKDAEEEDPQVEEEAKSTLVGHTQCVSTVVWPQDEAIYSASWDHSIRRWDVELGKDSLNLYCDKVINCLDVGGEGSALIAAGGSDPILRIWDPRKPGTSAPVYQFSSHSSWISTCKWHEKSRFHLLSASYDGKVMLWDLRTAWPLAVIDTHNDKVLCADWWKGESVVSGGADSKLCISSDVCVL